jgi:hypothetical protein
MTSLVLMLATGLAWGADYDCLNGTCLNTPVARNPPSTVVRYADTLWEKVVESCSGVIVNVTLRNMWANAEAWAAVKDQNPPPYIQEDMNNGELSRMVALNASVQMLQDGWKMGDAQSLTTGVHVDLTHPQKLGFRGLVHGPVQKLGSMVMIATLHPDLKRLCAKNPQAQ